MVTSQIMPSIVRRVKSVKQLVRWLRYIRAVGGVGRGGEMVVLHCVFDYFRVDASHSVYSVRSHNAQMSHVDFLCVSFLNQGHPAQAVVISRVELTDALTENKNIDFFFHPSRDTFTHIYSRILTDELSVIIVIQVVPQGASCLSHRWCPNDEVAGF